MSNRWDERRKARERIGIPQPEWGDNVVSADFSRGRGATKQPGRARQPDPPSPVQPDGSDGAGGAGGKRARRGTGAEEPRSAREGWAAEEIMRTATAQADSSRLSRGRTYFRGGHATRMEYELGRV
ncbi:MAG: hypothetical protein L0J86_00930, partial [Corynebacterium sp.]|nr:hypothetical protein [Corynebacterium sp.]